METRLHKVYLGTSIPNSLELVNILDAQAYVADYLKRMYDIDGFTVTTSIGYWKGQRETVLVFEVIDDNSIPWEGLTDLGNNLKNRYYQESVLVTKQSISAEFV